MRIDRVYTLYFLYFSFRLNFTHQNNNKTLILRDLKLALAGYLILGIPGEAGLFFKKKSNCV